MLNGKNMLKGKNMLNGEKFVKINNFLKKYIKENLKKYKPMNRTGSCPAGLVQSRNPKKINFLQKLDYF